MNSRQLFKLILCLLFLTKFSIGKAQLTNSDIWIFDIVNNNDNFSFKNLIIDISISVNSIEII